MQINVLLERQNGKNYVKIETDDPDFIEDAVEEIKGDGWYDARGAEQVRDALSRYFDNHAEFYDAIGFESSTEHGGAGTSFGTRGFERFVREFFGDNCYRIKRVDPEKHGEKLQVIYDALAERIFETLKEYDEERFEEDDYAVRSQIRLDVDNSGTLRDPELMDEAVIVTGGRAHKIEMKPIEDAKTLDDIEDKVREDTKQVYETQVDARVNSLKQRVQDLQEELEKGRNEMFVEGIKMVEELEDWEVKDGRLVYQKRVHAKYATKTRGNDENPKKLTEEAQEKFYIDGLQLKLNPTVRKIYHDGGYHPHALDWGACGGSFKAPLREALDKAVEQMEQINLHAHNNNDAERDFRDNFEKYTVDDEEQEVWTA